MTDDRQPGASQGLGWVRHHALLGLAWVLAALGVVGFFVPLVPGVFLLILSATCAAKSCPALRRRIFALPRIGADVEAFILHGAMRVAAKRAALGGMTAGGIVTALVFGPDSLAGLSTLLGLSLAAAYVATRPTLARLPVETGTTSIPLEPLREGDH